MSDRKLKAWQIINNGNNNNEISIIMKICGDITAALTTISSLFRRMMNRSDAASRGRRSRWRGSNERQAKAEEI